MKEAAQRSGRRRVFRWLAGGSALGLGVSGAVAAVGAQGDAAQHDEARGAGQDVGLDLEGRTLRVSTDRSILADSLDDTAGSADLDTIGTDTAGTQTAGTDTAGTDTAGTASPDTVSPDTPDTVSPDTVSPDTPDTATPDATATADTPDEDNSGPSGGDEDNSGPGGGDEDSSGPGGGDEDNSGPGGGDD
jgi:hypothetical protein